MDELMVPGTDGCSALLFYDRSPRDPAEEITSFWFRVTNLNLSAAAEIHGEEGYPSPAELFAELAWRWSGWPGTLTWESFMGSLSLSCSHDRRGHITISVVLRSGDTINPDEWDVKTSVMIEAGQLEGIARKAKKFFGREWKGVM
jgi:uncharacterized protein DUF6228